MEKWYGKLTKVFNAHKTWEEVGLTPAKDFSKRPPSPKTNIFDEMKTNPKAYSMLLPSSVYDVRQYEYLQWVGKSRRLRRCRHYIYISPVACRQTNSFRDLELLMYVNERYQMPLDYNSYGLIHRSPWHDDDEMLKVQYMQRNMAVRIKKKNLYWKDFISFTNYLTEFKRACNFSRIHKRVSIWLFGNFVTGCYLAVIEAQIISLLTVQLSIKGLLHLTTVTNLLLCDTVDPLNCYRQLENLIL